MIRAPAYTGQFKKIRERPIQCARAEVNNLAFASGVISGLAISDLGMDWSVPAAARSFNVVSD